MPLYMQGVRGGNATSSGLALMPLFMSWAISVALAARALVHHGFRRAGMIGSGLVVVGLVLLVVGASFPAWSRPLFIVGLAIVGTGMGPTSISFILAIQHCGELGPARRRDRRGDVHPNDRRRPGRGPAGRRACLGARPAAAVAGGSGIDVAAALRPRHTQEARSERASSRALVQTNLGLTLRDVYILITLFAVMSMICAFWLPGRQATLAHEPAERARRLRRRRAGRWRRPSFDWLSRSA